MDILFTIILGVVLAEAMEKHGKWTPISGIGDVIVWGIVCLLAIALVRIPIYLLVLGPRFPFDASPTLQFISGVVAVVFWWAMVYWRIPMRLLGRRDTNG